MDDNSLENRILRKADIISENIRNKKEKITQHKIFILFEKTLIPLMLLSPIWLPILFTTIGAGLGCCSKSNTLGFLFFFYGPVVASFFIGIWGIFKCKTKGWLEKVGLMIVYSFISVFILFFIGWGSLLNLGAGP